MITDMWLMQDGIAEGHAIVVDMDGSTLAHLAKVNIIAMKKFMFYIQVGAGDVNNTFIQSQFVVKRTNSLFFVFCFN